MSVLDTIRNASRARRTIALCLDAGLQAEYDDLARSLDEAAALDEKVGSLADPAPNTRRVVEAMEAVRERMAASEVTFTFETLSWSERLALQAEHPPRDKSPIDSLRGYNMETFPPALIRASCVSITGADGETVTDIPDDAWESLLGAVNFKQADRLFAVALNVNDAEAKVPTSARFLLGSQDSEASSTPPDPGTSAPSGSKAGSRRTSRKSSATKKAASPDS